MTRVASRPTSLHAMPITMLSRAGAETGRVTAFVAAMTAGILALAGLTLDGGLALAAKVAAIGQAQEAARAGAQRIDLAAYRDDGTLRLQPSQAAAAARAYLSASEPGTTSPGAGRTASVTATDTTVTVTVTATQHTQLLQLVGIGSLTVRGTGTAQPHDEATGVTGATP